MNLRQMRLYYTKETVTDQKGRSRKKLVYHGPVYRLSSAEVKSARKSCWLGGGVSLFLFIGAGLIGNKGVFNLFVLPFYLMTLLGALYLISAAVCLGQVKDTLTEVDLTDGLNLGTRSFGMQQLFGALWVIADGVWMITARGGETPLLECVFMVAGLLMFLLGYFGRRNLKAMKPVKISEGTPIVKGDKL